MKYKPLQDPDLVHCRNVVERQVEHLTRLVDDLMDVSRISRGKITLQKVPLEISAIVARAVEMQRSLLDAKKQKLIIEQPDDPLIVEGDLTRLSEALSNLLNNAAKYTDERGQITLRVEQAPDGKAVLLRVKDNGMGIPPDMLPKVFEMFTQVDHTLKRAQGGLGIGLALVRKLAEMHDGSVEVSSEGLGKGSEFVLRLPLRTDLGLVLGQAVHETPRPLPHLRILVVDDNRDAAVTLAMALRLNGAQVETEHEAERAVETTERFRADVVLLDLGMPGMSGLEVARALRAQPFGAKLRLIAQTGWGQDEDRRRTREAGFDAHLTKPLDYAKLIEVLVEARPQPEQWAGGEGAGPRPASL